MRKIPGERQASVALDDAPHLDANQHIRNDLLRSLLAEAWVWSSYEPGQQEDGLSLYRLTTTRLHATVTIRQ